MLLAPTKSREKVFCSRSTSETTDLWRRVHSKGYFSYIKISYVHKFNESFENINLNVIDSSPARPSNFPYCFTISSSSLSIFQFQRLKLMVFFNQLFYSQLMHLILRRGAFFLKGGWFFFFSSFGENIDHRRDTIKNFRNSSSSSR